MITEFHKYICEGVRDQMTPKSREDIKVILDDYYSYPDKQLNIAAETGFIDIVQKAIDNGADVNDYERKALKGAIRGRQYDIIDLLMSSGLKLKQDDYTDEEIIKSVIESGDIKLVKSILKKKKLIRFNQIYLACQLNKFKILDYFLDKIKLSEDEQRTILEWAVVNKKINMLKYLFNKGIETTGHWIVQKAVETDRMDILEMVLEYGKFCKYTIDEAVIVAHRLQKWEMIDLLRGYKYTN
jgi:hypothetical protein